jgi:hypothetical protein
LVWLSPRRMHGHQLPSVTRFTPHYVCLVNIYSVVRWGPNDWNLELPFGFGLSISEIQNDFNISSNSSTAARLSTVSDFFHLDPIIFADRKKQPIGASQSAIQVLGPNNTQGQINITI